jgi:glycosyltransferase involved in cell wall biosynthesis
MDLKKIPLISVLIPVFNRVDLIEECVFSALNQTYQNYEIIIVDNCSTDGTWELLSKKYKNQHSVKLFRNKRNIGPVQNWKKCIDLAQGDYSKILFSDDTINYDYLSETIKFMEDNVAFVFTAAAIGPCKEKSVINYRQKLGLITSKTYINDAILSPGSLLSPGAALFRTADLQKSFVDNLPGFNSQGFSYYGAGPDLLLFLITASRYSYVRYCNSTSVFFRQHDGSATIAAHKINHWPIRSCYNMARVGFVKNYCEDIELISKLAGRIILSEMIETHQISKILFVKKTLKKYFDHDKINYFRCWCFVLKFIIHSLKLRLVNKYELYNK